MVAKSTEKDSVIHCFFSIIMTEAHIFVKWGGQIITSHMTVLESENLEFCIVLWGPLTEPVLVHVETSDFLTALGESFLNM